MTDISLGGITPLSSAPLGSFLLLAKVDPTNTAKKTFGGLAPSAVLTPLDMAAEVQARNQAIATAIAGVPGGTLVIDATYSASGAIDPSKSLVLLTGSTALAMTLGNGAGPRGPMFIKNENTATATVTLTLDTVSSKVMNIGPGGCVELAWSVIQSSYVILAQYEASTPLGSLPTLTNSSSSNFIPILDIDGVTLKKISPSSLVGTPKNTRIITASGGVSVVASDGLVVINKTTGAATTVTLEATPTTGSAHRIKDGKGDAATNNITILPSSGTIDGAANFVINANRMAVTIEYSGVEWVIV